MVPFKVLWSKLIAAWKTTSRRGWGLKKVYDIEKRIETRSDLWKR
jgi:hypothetical protein